MEIEVFGFGLEGLGTCASFGDAKRLQQDSLPDDLKPLYAGIEGGMPLFYSDMLTDELRAKYPQLGDNQ